MSFLKLLLLEDSPDDEKLVLREFKKAGYEITHQRIQTATELNHHLEKENNNWDIIISDYQMPSFDGLSALEILKNRNIDIPFIIVSGQIGESMAVKAMRAGADDYVMKGNLHRLIPATERAIKEAWNRKEKLKTEQALKDAHLRMEGIIASAMDAIITINQTHQVVMMNKAAEDLFAHSAGDIIGKDLNTLIPQRFHKVHDQHINHFGSSGKTSRMMGMNRTVYGIRADGREFPMEASISQLQLGDQKYYTVILRDISLRMEAEKQEKQLNAELIRQNEQLQQFGYVTSHNIRGPLATTMGLINLLKNSEPLLKENEQLFTYLDKSVDKLDQVITDMNTILEYKIHLNTHKEKVELAQVLANVRKELLPYIGRSGVELSGDFSQVDFINTVKVYIHNIFYNLISNSIKYRDPQKSAKIMVSSSIVKKDNQKLVCLRFADNGVGIDLSTHKDKIFGLYKRFHQHVEGKGLGLHLVKTQVEALNGLIEVESKEGIGTIFQIYLPHGTY